MKYKVVVSNNAKIDILNALKWYKENASYKVKALNTQINKTAKSLSKFPERFQKKYQDHRFAPIANFEYNLHYYIDVQNCIVVITALFHYKQYSQELI